MVELVVIVTLYLWVGRTTAPLEQVVGVPQKWGRWKLRKWYLLWYEISTHDTYNNIKQRCLPCSERNWSFHIPVAIASNLKTLWAEEIWNWKNVLVILTVFTDLERLDPIVVLLLLLLMKKMRLGFEIRIWHYMIRFDQVSDKISYHLISCDQEISHHMIRYLLDIKISQD